MPHWFIDRDERHLHAQKYKQAYQMICGAASGAITKTATAPLERVKILLQLQGMSGALKGLPPSSNILQVMAYMWKEDGVRGLFKGNGANVARVIPVYALKFSFNERFRDLVRTPGQRDHHLSFVQLISAGTLAGLTQIVITYPLELIRTRLSLSNNTTSATQTGKYNGMIDCAVKTVRVEGVRALYKGLWATIWSGAPYVGLQMTTYEMVKRTLPHTQTHQDSHGNTHMIVSPTWKLVAGGLSGLISQTITFPGDTVRRRMQTNGLSGMAKVYDSTWDCCKKIYRYEGIPGFFKGAMTNVYRSVPGAALQFGTYDLFKHLFGIAGEG